MEVNRVLHTFAFFGCIAFGMVPDARRIKLHAKAEKCVFIGFCEGTKAYRLMSLETKKIIRSRDVAFYEESTVMLHLEDGRSGRWKNIIVDTSSKSLIVNVCDEHEKHGNLKALSNGSKEVQVENTFSYNQQYSD